LVGEALLYSTIEKDLKAQYLKECLMLDVWLEAGVSLLLNVVQNQ